MKTNPKIKELVKNPTIKRSIKAGNVNIILSDKKNYLPINNLIYSCTERCFDQSAICR